MKIGVTGTRDGMTVAQVDSFTKLMGMLSFITEFHHGDCVGVDDQAADIVAEEVPSCKIHCHPPVEQSLRACNDKHVVIHQERTYFERNRNIVDACDLLVVVPKQTEHQSRGGTWQTYDYGMKRRKRMVVVWPDGGQTWIGEPQGRSDEQAQQRAS